MYAINYLIKACVYAAVFTAMTFSANAFAQTFDFTIDVLSFYNITGQFFTQSAGPPNTFLVTGIAGTANGQAITGLEPVTIGFGEPDNLLYYPASDPNLVDFYGISFDAGSGATAYVYNLYQYNDQYSLDTNDPTDNPLEAQGGFSGVIVTVMPDMSVPEPSTYVLLSSLIALIPIVRRYRLKAA
jgi:hypothetical protein